MFGLESSILFHFLFDERGRFALAAILTAFAVLATATVLAVLEVGQDGEVRTEVFAVGMGLVLSDVNAYLVWKTAFFAPRPLLQQSLF